MKLTERQYLRLKYRILIILKDWKDHSKTMVAERIMRELFAEEKEYGLKRT